MIDLIPIPPEWDLRMRLITSNTASLVPRPRPTSHRWAYCASGHFIGLFLNWTEMWFKLNYACKPHTKVPSCTQQEEVSLSTGLDPQHWSGTHPMSYSLLWSVLLSLCILPSSPCSLSSFSCSLFSCSSAFLPWMASHELSIEVAMCATEKKKLKF